MEDKYIPYSVDGREYKIPESEVDAFEKHYPSATIKMKVDDRLYNVPLDKKEEFTKYYTNASYALDDDSPSLGETIAKSTASAAVRTAKRGVDLFHVLSSNMPYYDPIDELYKMPESLDERLQDPNNKVRNASIHLGELANRLSKEADPTGGQKDFLELIGEGQLGKALQKGVATTLESSPNTLAARHWSTMLLNAAGMAAENYVEDTLNNPETEKWKRATYAIGSAAIEQAVEKFADPIFKYIGGNATGKLTKETAEEIIRQARNEATETIVKRINKVLSNVAKNTGKDALGEGAEEVITSFGNDALGEALDAIDGDKDYGIRAQWEKLKEENPDAEIKDFALAKAKEYVNAFIGGAMSGGIMSGPTQTIAEASNAFHESEVNRQVSAGNTIGQELNIQNLYDVDENIKATSASVVQAFTDENGESIIDNTFIDELTSEDALALSRSRDISSEQRSALEKFAFARSMQEGLNQTLDAKVDNDVNKQKEIIEDVANNSQVVTGVYNGKRVYVKGGLARVNGTIVLPDGKNGPVVIIDATTGQQTSVRSEDISRAVAHDAEEFGRMMEDTIRNADASVRAQARNTMSPLAKKRAIQPFAGKKILVDLGNGITEVYVQQVSPNGNVILKGKKGDLGGQSIVTLNAETFYDSIYRDDTGNPVVTEVSKEEAERLNVREAEAPQQASASENAPESETTSEQRTASGADYRGESVTIIIDGVPVNVDVVSQDNVSDSIVYEYVDANGRTRRKSATIADFENAVLKAQQYTEANKPMEDTVSTEPAEEPATETPATEAPVTEAPVSEEPVVAEPQAPLTPESINWDELFEQDKEAFFAEIQNQFGDRAVTFLNKFIDFANKELEKLNKVNPTKFNDIIANENAIAAVQAKIDTLKEMADRLTPKESAPEASVVPTQPTTPEPPQQTPNVPDVSLDKASDARARGFRMTNGQRVDRREATAGVYGNDIEVAFAAESKGKRNGKIKVIDASNLVPSHISGVENIEHFLPEAQPKKRTDKASSVSASLIAQNMNNPQMTNVASSAYEGAPIVNRRGEVIQGNNRSAAILEMYQSHPENADAYKQYLIDHASEFGLTPEDVASMQNPVLVRELDVDDTDAITLGQYTMQDMESGGNQMIDSGRAIAGLNNKGLLEDFITRLLAEENDDTSDMNLSDLIIRNGNDALKMLFHNGIINQTQYQSAIGANGKITADARAALRGIIEQQLFAGGIDNISIMFEVLPDKAKKAIMQTIARDLKNPDDAKVTPYLQEAIEVYYKLNQQSDFVAAKSEEDVDRAIKAFKGQTSLDEAGTPAEKYSNFAFVLAKQFKTKTLKQQRDLLNHLYDVIAGETNIFGESEGKTLADAVEEVYGTNLNKGNHETNGQSGAAVLESGNGGSQEGQQGSAEGVGVRTNVGEGGQGTTNGGANQTVGRGNEAAGEVKPVAPNPVSDPIAEAKKIEMHLAIQLQRNLDDGQKEDLARNLGKKIGDLFATKEEYDSYQETATDFGAYNEFVEQGVESSFANRQPNVGVSPANSVSLEAEPKGENNGEQGASKPTESDTRQGNNGDIPPTTDTRGQEDAEGNQEAESEHESKGTGSKAIKVEDRYPARKGNATKELLKDTFGFASVAIPNTRKETLNAIYDFMMEMSKMLGISPKSIGQGGMLDISNLRANAGSVAEHSLVRKSVTKDFVSASLKFKYAQLEGIAHEWWHALDYALVYFDKKKAWGTATAVNEKQFSGRKETLEAVRNVIEAIIKSGYTNRIRSLTYSPKLLAYYLDPTEMAARAFDVYIRNKFAEAGITIKGANYDYIKTEKSQQTEEEMKVITPALDKLFEVLQEKEGKTAGTSILYHIGQEVDSKQASNEARESATDAVLTKLQEANIPVEIATQEMVNQTSDGILKTPNGIVYGWTDGDKIYLTEAGINPNTPIHEYTHLWADAMMRKNPKGWNSVKNLLKGTPVWNEVINDSNYSDIKDNENEVASEVLSRISGTKNAEKLEQMAQQMLNEAKGTARKLEAQGIIQRIKDALNKFWNWVGTELFGIENFESVEQIADRVLWDLMNNTDLDAPYSNEPTEIIGKNGDVIADTDGKGKVRFSISTWENGGRDYLQAWLDKDKTLAADEKADILARMDEFYENAKKYTDVYVPFGTWSDAAVRYDENGNPLMSVIKANGDYAMNLDFSLVCKKRRPLNRLLRTLINRNAFGTYSLREREIAEINWILQEHGFEVACALCFVDSRRYRVTGVADVFSSLYNKFVKALAPEGAEIAHFNYSSNPNVADVENGIDTLPDEQLNWEKFNELASKYTPTSVGGKVAKLLRENPSQRKLVDSTDFIDANGFEAVKENNQALLSLYNSKKGTGGPKASFGDVQYLNDILKKDKSFDVEKAYAVGGVRIQSFSDFVPHMYFDYMQLFAELSAKKLPAHAYTKEVLFAKIFGMTGLKINMSLVPAVVEGGVAPGLDANGNYAWADAIKDKDGNIIQQAQSFPYDEAMAIQNAEGYSKNCGVIAVGISDEHIEKMLDDENIPFIIPYHNSSLNAIVARMTNINKYKDYSKVQNTRHADGTKLDKGTKDFNFNAYLREHPNATPQQAAQAYLDWCKKHKYKPKFNQFAYHPNYYKLLVDFNTIDSITGEYTPQGPVSMTFPTEQSQFGNVETLIQQGLSEDAALEEKMDAEIDAIAEEVEERLKEIAKEPKLSQKKQAAAMAKLADERMAKINARAESNEEFDGILSRSGDITPEVDAEYLAAVESGDMEKAQQMVNEAYDRYLNEMLLPNDEDEVGFKYHRGPAPTKTFKRYAVLNVTPDGFKAAYAGNKTGTPVGVWLDAQNLASYTSDMVQFDDGTFATYIAGDTGAATNTKFSPEKAEKLGIKGSQKWLLERGGKHSSDVPNFSQMNLKVNEKGEKVASAKEGALPHNKLIFEIEYGISDDGDLTDYVRENGRKMKGKNQGLAKIGPNQYYDFKTNPNAVGNWGIGGTFRITRLVPHSEIVSVTEQYKKDAIAEANKLYESGKISQKDRDARIKSAESIQIQKWVGGYNPSDFGLTEESVKEMVEKGSRMKLTDAVTYDDAGNVIPLSERFNPEKKDMRYRRQDEQNTAIDRLTGEARNFAIENAVNEEAEKLGVKVTYKTRKDMPKGHQNDKGYYNTKTGEIVICTENATSVADAIQTILHEAVAHKGLRQLMGDKFNEFINRVYESLDAETKEKVDALARNNYNGDTAIAMEEYMATLAETTDFNNNSVWDKIKSIFEDIINAILGRNDIKIGDNELRYILRASYNNMVNPRGMESVAGWAQDQMMRDEYKINQSSPEILSRTGIDPNEVARETASATYDRVVSETWQEFQRQFQDAYQPVRIAIDAIQQETGNIPIEDYENYLLMQNQSSSRSRVEIDDFERKYYSPIVEQTNKIIDEIMKSRNMDPNDKEQRAQVYKEVTNYLIAKHGLERNAYYQKTKKRLLNAEEKKYARQQAAADYADELSKIASTYKGVERVRKEYEAKDKYEAALAAIEHETTADIRDYSGLTSLYGLKSEDFLMAEAQARKDVARFESMVATDSLWKAINAATDKTLRHTYESGLISRKQYEDIKAMFNFYIPLRGFDETTAEDVYSYSRFEGNRFNPTLQKVKGRTSLADDPLAIIMNMAESEIAQGNKNRAKQALYNFILNRVRVDENGNEYQNSLMQVEDVWYLKTVDSNGNDVYTIATPNHEIGESYEDFEKRMQSLAASDMAMKSKKGQVDVGMRFQKQMNKNAHYIYLKVNGVDKAIFINGNPKAAEAINGTHQQNKHFGEDKMRTLNRLISSSFTNYSLEFTARNYFRDMIYAHINIDVKESDPAYRKKFRQNWRRNNLGTMIKMLKAYRAGEFEGRQLTEDEAAFVEFMNNGGQTGYTLINSVERHKKELESAIENMRKGIIKGGVKDSTIFRYSLGAIELLNESSELVTRFAAFKTSRDMGRSVLKSISDAKEITVNFNTKGAQDGTGWMGFIAKYFGWSKYFFNASVQGVQNVTAMAKANTLKFCSVVGGVAATGFIMPIVMGAISELFGDDEDEYWNIPEYERQNNLCIPIPFLKGKYAKVPLPIGFREVYAIGDMVAAMAFDKKFSRDVKQVGMDIANKIAYVLLPVNPLESASNGLNFWHTFLYTALPSSAQLVIQNATNMDWKGAPLQKEYTYNAGDPQWMKAYASNPDWMKGLSKWCNEHIHPYGDYRGLDWSPEKLDNILSNMLGGIYSLIKKSGKTISMAWNEENRNLHNIPLAGVVLGSGIEDDDSFVTDTYFDMKAYYDSNIGDVKRIAKQFGYDLDDVFIRQKGKHHPKMQEVYNNRIYDFMKEWYIGNKELQELDKEVKKVKKKVAATEYPSEQLLDKLIRKENKFASERRDFVNDMLEID